MITINWGEYHSAVRKLAEQIPRDKYRFLYGISRGGLIPAVMLSHILDIPLIGNPSVSKEILIVDDIAHHGKTIRQYSQWDTATVYMRVESDVMPTFYGEALDDWVWRMFPYEIESQELDQHGKSE